MIAPNLALEKEETDAVGVMIITTGVRVLT